MRSSSAWRRSSSRRAASVRPCSHPSSSVSALPRHSASASSTTKRARSDSPSVEQLLGPVDQALEAVGVELLSRQRQPVAQTAGLDGIGAEHLAQPHHATLDHLRPRGRRKLPSPQRIGQHVGADHLAPTNGQHPEHDPLSRCQSGVIAVDRHRAENGDGHPGEHSQDCRVAVNCIFTALIPPLDRPFTARRDGSDRSPQVARMATD